MPRTVLARRRPLVVTAALAVALALVVPPAAIAAPVRIPAVAAAPVPVVDRVAAAPTVTLAGSLQSELGCGADWDPACAATDLAESAPGLFSATFAVPHGSYEYKVVLNHSWDESYGAGGVKGGANIPLVLAGDASVKVSFDSTTHRISVSPAVPQPGLTKADKALAGSSLRSDLTRERFYFVMTDRFANADKSNDAGGLTGDKMTTGLDPDRQGLLPRRRHQGHHRKARLPQGSRRHVGLDDAVVQEQSRAGSRC